MSQLIKVIVTRGSQKFEINSEPFASITDILEDLKIDKNLRVKINGNLVNNLNSQIQQFNQQNIVNIDLQRQGIQILDVKDQKNEQQQQQLQQIEQNQGKLLEFTIKIQNGHSGSSFNIEIGEFTPMSYIVQIVYQKLAFYNKARDMVDIDLYVNQLVLKGVKLSKSPNDLNYQTGTIIEAKLRWVGGKF